MERSERRTACKECNAAAFDDCAGRATLDVRFCSFSVAIIAHSDPDDEGFVGELSNGSACSQRPAESEKAFWLVPLSEI